MHLWKGSNSLSGWNPIQTCAGCFLQSLKSVQVVYTEMSHDCHSWDSRQMWPFRCKNKKVLRHLNSLEVLATLPRHLSSIDIHTDDHKNTPTSSMFGHGHLGEVCSTWTRWIDQVVLPGPLTLGSKDYINPQTGSMTSEKNIFIAKIRSKKLCTPVPVASMRSS